MHIAQDRPQSLAARCILRRVLPNKSTNGLYLVPNQFETYRAGPSPVTPRGENNHRYMQRNKAEQ